MIAPNNRVIIGRVVLSAALIGLLADSSSAADLEHILKNPRAYHHQRVSVTGVARGEGYSFELFQNPKDAKTIARPARTLVVARHLAAPMYGSGKYDRCWVRLTGIIDADRHGRWNFPCELLLEKIERLSKPLFESSLILGVFRNDSMEALELHFLNSGGGIYAKVPLEPRGTDDLAIQKGTVEVLGPSGKVLAKHPLNAIDTTGEYFDAANRAYYYRFKNGRIERLLAKEGRKWGVFSRRIGEVRRTASTLGCSRVSVLRS